MAQGEWQGRWGGEGCSLEGKRSGEVGRGDHRLQISGQGWGGGGVSKVQYKLNF